MDNSVQESGDLQKIKLRLLIINFFIALSILSILGIALVAYTELEKLKLNDNHRDEKLSVLFERISEIENANKSSEESQKLKDIISRSGDMEKSEQKSTTNLTGDTKEIIEFLFEEIEGSTGRFKTRPVAFSYFTGVSWKKEKETVQSKIFNSPMKKTAFDGGSGVDEFKIVNAGVIEFDGVFSVRFEKYNIKNNLSNKVEVLAPSLADLEQNELFIIADKEFDEIKLDGCLFWTKKESKDEEYDKWQTKDINGDIRIVYITRGVPQSVNSECDNRYLDFYKRGIVKYILNKTKQEEGQNSEENFTASNYEGGIGIQFDRQAPMSLGLVIVGIVPGQAAQNAGLKTGDSLIKIDGDSVSTMTHSEAASKLRGEVGSFLEVSYLPLGKNPEMIETVKLKRTQINVIDRKLEGFQSLRDSKKTLLEQGVERGNFVKIDEGMISSDKKLQNREDKLVWVSVDDNLKSFIVTPEILSEKIESKTFILENQANVAVKVPKLSVSIRDTGDSINYWWEIFPESTCINKILQAGERCSVIVRPTPEVDGQFSGYLRVGDKSTYLRSEEKSWIFLQGYAKGISGKLPNGVTGNGDECPQVGKSADVAVSSGPGGSDGYFQIMRSGSDVAYSLVTAGCAQWAGDQKQVYCPSNGVSAHSAKMKKYSAYGTNGPWQLVEAKENYISVRVTCENGIINRVKWSW